MPILQRRHIIHQLRFIRKCQKNKRVGKGREGGGPGWGVGGGERVRGRRVQGMERERGGRGRGAPTSTPDRIRYAHQC